MMQTLEVLQQQIKTRWGESITESRIACNELTITVAPNNLLSCCQWLRDELHFEQLVDACGVDYLQYGCSEWDTQGVTTTGFDRAVDLNFNEGAPLRTEKRFAVVYHLLSISKNVRVRVRVFPEGDPPLLDSVISVWPSVNWYEREAFDLYGILFNGHPDLRRILTDYGFIGYPFRKDFPLSGKVEVRYDAELGRVIYEPVDIVPRVLEPKVIPKDNRYKEISKEKSQ